MGALDEALSGRRALLVVAVDAEANAVRRGLGLASSSPANRWTPVELTDRLDLAISGVGKSNAAGATARSLDPHRHALVINLGVAGALPVAQTLEPGAVVVASRSVFADEGMGTPDGFRSLAAMGFPPLLDSGDGMGVDAHPALLAALTPFADRAAPIATVSTCSASDSLAQETAHRTRAAAEAMEGAAVATVVHTLGVPFIEARAISNTTGDRDRQRWDIRLALDALARFVARW